MENNNEQIKADLLKMGFPIELIEEQEKLESSISEAVRKRMEDEIGKKVKDCAEHEMSYGRAIMASMIKVAEEYIHGLRIKGRQTGKIFLNTQIFTRYAKFQADIENKVKKELRTEDPIAIVAQALAFHLTSRLSSGDSVKAVAERAALDVCHHFGLPLSEWEDRKADTMKFFVACIREIAGASEFFSVDSENNNNREHQVYLNPDKKEAIEKAKLHLMEASFGYKPSLLPPKDHTNLISKDGGYWFTQSPLLKRPADIKTFGARDKIVSRSVRDAVKNFTVETNPEYFFHINRSQKVGYTINTEILDIIDAFKNKKDANGNNTYFFEKYPYEVDEEAHKKAADDEINKRNENRAARAKKEKVEFKPLLNSTKNKVYRKYASIANEQERKTLELLGLAQEFRGRTFYFPIYVDHRGRRYPYVTGELSPQGNKLAKGLLEYADKHVLTEEGVEVLFESLANSIASIGDKIDCVKKAEMARVWFWGRWDVFEKKDYELFFTHQDEFDEPINAMVVVNELVNHFKDPEGYKSGYIAHRDARCSGASIVGTAVRCKDLMEMTSVIDWKDEDDRLGDVYMRIADYARELCEEYAKTDKIYAYLLAHSNDLFVRKPFKNPVMVTSNYGGTAYGMRLMNKKFWEEQNLFKKKAVKDGGYEEEEEALLVDESAEDTGLSEEHIKAYNSLMLEAMSNAIPSQQSWMEGAKAASKEMAYDKGYIEFINPITGFPVSYQTFVYENKKFVAHEAGKRAIAITLKTITPKLNKQRMVSSFQPNCIHSVDASLLSLVELGCDFDLTLIHDSIGSHPNNTKRAVEAYGRAMGILADGDVLNKVFASMGVNTRIELTNTFTGELTPSLHALV